MRRGLPLAPAGDQVSGLGAHHAHRIRFAMSQHRLYLRYLDGALFGAKQKAPAAAPKAP